MRDHSIYILCSLSSKDLQRTLRKSSVRPVVSLSHAPKLALRALNSINPAKIVRKCLGTERFSQISRIPRAKRESEKFSAYRKTQVNRLTCQILIHPLHILKYLNSPIWPIYFWLFALLTTNVDNKVVITVILFHFFFHYLTFQVAKVLYKS